MELSVVPATLVPVVEVAIAWPRNKIVEHLNETEEGVLVPFLWPKRPEIAYAETQLENLGRIWKFFVYVHALLAELLDQVSALM